MAFTTTRCRFVLLTANSKSVVILRKRIESGLLTAFGYCAKSFRTVPNVQYFQRARIIRMVHKGRGVSDRPRPMVFRPLGKLAFVICRVPLKVTLSNKVVEMSASTRTHGIELDIQHKTMVDIGYIRIFIFPASQRWLRNSSDCPQLYRPPTLNRYETCSEYPMMFSHEYTTIIYLLGTGK